MMDDFNQETLTLRTRRRRGRKEEIFFVGWIKRSGSNNLMVLGSSFYSLTQPITMLG